MPPSPVSNQEVKKGLKANHKSKFHICSHKTNTLPCAPMLKHFSSIDHELTCKFSAVAVLHINN